MGLSGTAGSQEALCRSGLSETRGVVTCGVSATIVTRTADDCRSGLWGRRGVVTCGVSGTLGTPAVDCRSGLFGRRGVVTCGVSVRTPRCGTPPSLRSRVGRLGGERRGPVILW